MQGMLDELHQAEFIHEVATLPDVKYTSSMR
jgi:hypothetical protein